MTDRTNTLKTLLTRLIDSRDGYRDALEHVESAHIKSLLSDFADRRDRNAAELRSYLAGAGQTIEDDGSLLAAVHRTFMGLKDSLTGSDDHAALEEIVRGENKLLETYDEAIEAAGGTDPEYQFLVEQHASLKLAISELDTRTDLAAE